jgi:hypothetical protein
LAGGIPHSVRFYLDRLSCFVGRTIVRGIQYYHKKLRRHAIDGTTARYPLGVARSGLLHMEERQPTDETIKGLTTKADKIRALVHAN